VTETQYAMAAASAQRTRQGWRTLRAGGLFGLADSSALECSRSSQPSWMDLTVRQLVLDNALSSADVSLANLSIAPADAVSSPSRAFELERPREPEEGLAGDRAIEDRGPYILEKVTTRTKARGRIARPESGPEARLAVTGSASRRLTGDVVLLRRDYDIVDEEQPSVGADRLAVFRERRLFGPVHFRHVPEPVRAAPIISGASFQTGSSTITP